MIFTTLYWSFLQRLFLVASLTILVLHPGVISAQNDEDVIPGRYIVVLKQQQSVASVAESFGFVREQTYEHVFSGMAISATQSQIEKLRHDPRVVAIEPDRIVHALYQRVPTGIDRSEADANPLSKINGRDERVNVDIAIIDTGISKTHKDLNLYKFVNFTAGNDDGNGHGTHVAGIAAALDNDVGVVGMAPGARLWAVKVLNDFGQGSISDLIKGIDYVTEHADEIDVANMSLGGMFSSDILDMAITNSVKAGVTYVVAAGNDAQDAGTFSPANHPLVLTVSAIADSDGKPGGKGNATKYGADDSFASFSNFGNLVEIAAPGVDIYSSYKGTGYRTLSGTSMASPHVAGAVALYIAEHGRDLNNDKKIDDSDVALIRQATIDEAIPQHNANGFSGDSDGFAEPLVYVGAPIPQPSFAMSVFPKSIQMNANSIGNTTIHLGSVNGFTGTIRLNSTTSSQSISASVLPASLTLGPSENKTATLEIHSQGAAGTFNATLVASDGKISHRIVVPVSVNQAGGCLIATAAFGTELAPQVQLLREIRDNVLFSTNSGTAFMAGFDEFYYSFSPTIADWERQSPELREAVAIAITPMISTLSILDHIHIDSEQKLIGYGLGLVLVNMVMYVGAPIFLMLKIKNRLMIRH